MNSRGADRFVTGVARRVLGRRSGGFTLVELIVVSIIIGVVILILGKFFLNYFASFRETQARLRLQRDMGTLSYWVRKDLSALAQRPGNFDLKNTGSDYAFIAADDPSDTYDWGTNTTDSGLDRFTYTFAGNLVTRSWNRLGTMSNVQNLIMIESIEPSHGDTMEVRVTLYDDEGETLVRSAFDGTLGNFESDSAVRRIDMQIVFSKRPTGYNAANRPSIIERAEIKSVALYRRSG